MVPLPARKTEHRTLLKTTSHLKSNALIVLLLCAPIHGRLEYPLSQFPIYTQAPHIVGYCVSLQSSAFSNSFGCPIGTPGPCLCTDALKSSKVLQSISSCVVYDPYDQQTSAAQLWQDYCKTNGGVNVVHSETALQNIPLYTQITPHAAACLGAGTSTYSTTFGCSEYTLAPCLCANTDSSNRVWASASSCLKYDSADQVYSASMLWSSFCNINLATPAQRVVGSPITVSATPTPTTDKYGFPITSASPGSTTGPSTATPTSNSSSGSSGGSNTSSSNSGGSNVNWNAIGAAIGVAGILVAIVIAWWTNKKNQWFQHAILRMGFNQHHQPQQQFHQPQQQVYHQGAGMEMGGYGNQQPMHWNRY